MRASRRRWFYHAIGGRESISILGGLFIVLATLLVFDLVSRGSPPLDVFIAFSLSAGPGLILIYQSYQLPDTNIDPQFYPVLGAWCVGSIIVTAATLMFYHFQPGAGIFTHPFRMILNLASLGGVAGYAVGFHDARARTQATDLEQRNTELQHIREELKESNDRLEQRNTELHQARENLKEYERIVETVDEGIYVLDEAGRFKRVNDGFMSLTNYDRSELLDTHASVVFGEEFEIDREKRQQFKSGEITVASYEEEINTSGGETVIVESRFKPFEVEGGWGRVGVIRDITELKEYQRQLEESNERLEQFAYAASHDLQEPLRMVSSYLQLLEDRYAGELDEDAEEFIDFAVDGAERMRGMINDLLAYSRIDTEAAPLEPTDTETVVENALKNLERRIEETDATIDIGLLPTVQVDPSQLEQVFQNLVSNAIKYRGDEPPGIEISAERDGGEWVFQVADNGMGMEPDQIDRIFDVFERLHADGEYSGTGIGLALCEKIIDRHGGEIWVESEPGEGSTFYFTIPDSTGSRVLGDPFDEQTTITEETDD